MYITITCIFSLALRVTFRLFVPDFPQRCIRCSRNLNHSQRYRLTCNIAVLQHKLSDCQLPACLAASSAACLCLLVSLLTFFAIARKHVFGCWLLTDGLSFVACWLLISSLTAQVTSYCCSYYCSFFVLVFLLHYEFVAVTCDVLTHRHCRHFLSFSFPWLLSLPPSAHLHSSEFVVCMVCLIIREYLFHGTFCLCNCYYYLGWYNYVCFHSSTVFFLLTVNYSCYGRLMSIKFEGNLWKLKVSFWISF